jgi:hypothetical protein
MNEIDEEHRKIRVVSSASPLVTFICVLCTLRTQIFRAEGGGSFLSNLWGENSGVELDTDSAIETFGVYDYMHFYHLTLNVQLCTLQYRTFYSKSAAKSGEDEAEASELRNGHGTHT